VMRRGGTGPAWPWPAMFWSCPSGFLAWARCSYVQESMLGQVVAKTRLGLIKVWNLRILQMFQSPLFACS
jgi:hypothetical protein